MFLKRIYQPEIMDDFLIRDERIDNTLKELKIINKYLGGNSTTKSGLKNLLNCNVKKEISILDIGSGGVDDLLSLEEFKDRMNIFCIDKNIRICSYSKKNKNELNIICADVYNLPLKKVKFDFIHASLFFHHFKEDEIIVLLKNLFPLAKKGIIINDLRRSIFAYIGISLLTKLFSKSNMIKNDAPLSVKRSFIKKDLKYILNSIGISNYKIKRKWAFRWLVIIKLDK